MTSPLLGIYHCPNGCGRVITMPGGITRHLLTCATTIEQLKHIGGADTASDDDCWLWRGLDVGKRKRISHQGRRRYVYVVAYMLSYGADPGESGLLTCHHCDDSRCFNPKHLFAGTNADNLHDMALKGRSGGFRTMDPLKQLEIARKGAIPGGIASGVSRRRIANERKSQ